MTTELQAVHGRINDLDSHLQVPISRWAEVFGEATARFGERFAGIALDPSPSTAEQFSAYIKEDFARWTKVVKDADIKLD